LVRPLHTGTLNEGKPRNGTPDTLATRGNAYGKSSRTTRHQQQPTKKQRRNRSICTDQTQNGNLLLPTPNRNSASRPAHPSPLTHRAGSGRRPCTPAR
jgi:hypothetical protein